jgi:hypothetical protein
MEQDLGLGRRAPLEPPLLATEVELGATTACHQGKAEQQGAKQNQRTTQKEPARHKASLASLAEPARTYGAVTVVAAPS